MFTRPRLHVILVFDNRETVLEDIIVGLNDLKTRILLLLLIIVPGRERRT